MKVIQGQDGPIVTLNNSSQTTGWKFAESALHEELHSMENPGYNGNNNEFLSNLTTRPIGPKFCI